MKLTYIYGLYDPRNPKMIMYVGKGLSVRASSHWKNFCGRGTAVNAKILIWFKKLKSEAVEPKWRVLQTIPYRFWEKYETRWIKHWKKKNPNLCNICDGGNSWPIEAGRIGGSATNATTNGRKGNGGRIGGKIGGSKGGKIGGYRVEELHPGHFSRMGKKGGKRLAELYPHSHFVEMGKIGGKIGANRQSKEDKAKGGKVGGVVATHLRWHIARGIKNPKCRLCR